MFEENMLKKLQQAMQEELDKIAEPIMAKALADIQTQLRRRMGSLTIALLETSFSMERCGPDLRILVHMKEPKA